MHLIASIEDPVVINQFFDPLDRRAVPQSLALRALARAPPRGELPGLAESG